MIQASAKGVASRQCGRAQRIGDVAYVAVLEHAEIDKVARVGVAGVGEAMGGWREPVAAHGVVTHGHIAAAQVAEVVVVHVVDPV